MRTQSIHPRVVNGRTQYEKVNTAKTRDKTKLPKILQTMQKHMEEHPRDKATVDHYNKLQY